MYIAVHRLLLLSVAVHSYDLKSWEIPCYFHSYSSRKVEYENDGRWPENGDSRYPVVSDLILTVFVILSAWC